MIQFKGKALYNLLRSNWLQDPNIQVEPWQVEDYRSLQTHELFDRLHVLGAALNQESFLLYAESSDSPEELLDCVCLEEEDVKTQDRIYLLLFELWRRLLPKKRTFSIFCDELDCRIDWYEKDLHAAEAAVQESLEELENILDENVDLGASPKEVFASLEGCWAHNIESFLYDYISSQIEQGNDVYASELLDGFFDYVQDVKWFDFLRARLFTLSDAHAANLMISGLLEQLEEEPDLELLLELCAFLVHAGDPSLFIQAVKQALPLLQSEEDVRDLAWFVAEYFRCLDQESKAQELLQKHNVSEMRDALQNMQWNEV